jgi:hypothetical protein
VIRAALASLALLATLPQSAQAALLDPNYRTVLPQDQVAQVMQNSCDMDPALQKGPLAPWTPSAAEIAAAEKALPFALRDAIRTAPQIGPQTRLLLTQWESIANHARQYGGVTVAGHRAIVVIGAQIGYVDFDGPYTIIPPDAGAPWRTRQSILVPDSGPMSFLTTYDPATGKFGAFHFCGTIAGYGTP